MADGRFKTTLLIYSVLVALLGGIAYRLATANPTATNSKGQPSTVRISDPFIAMKLSKNAGDNSNEESSAEEKAKKLASPSWSGDHSKESKELLDDDSHEITVFSATVVKTDANGTKTITNIQKWEKPAPPNTSTDATVIYFLDDSGEPQQSNVSITEINIARGNIPCNNGKKMQFFSERDRCNGIYSCDDNSADEKACPSKCIGFRYPSALNLSDCKAYIPRFFYDYEKQRCEFFAYGGCAHVVNMFLSASECQRECTGITLTTTLPVIATTTIPATDINTQSPATPADVNKLYQETATSLSSNAGDFSGATTTSTEAGQIAATSAGSTAQVVAKPVEA